MPLCVSIPGGILEEGTLIALIGTPNQSFNRRYANSFIHSSKVEVSNFNHCQFFFTSFNIDFIVEKCEHAHRLPEKQEKKKKKKGEKGEKGEKKAKEGGDASESVAESTGEAAGPSTSAGESTNEDGEERDKQMVASSEDTVVAFHFNPRFGSPLSLVDSPVVVMNSRFSGDWGVEERPEPAGGYAFPFTIGTPFQLMILVEKEHFKVAIDGRHCYEYRHRTDFKDIRRIHVEGALSLDVLEFRKELKYKIKASEKNKHSSFSAWFQMALR